LKQVLVAYSGSCADVLADTVFFLESLELNLLDLELGVAPKQILRPCGSHHRLFQSRLISPLPIVPVMRRRIVPIMAVKSERGWIAHRPYAPPGVAMAKAVRREP
jgi:hypothetical protein